LFQPSSVVCMKLTSVLLMAHFEIEEWRPLPGIGKIRHHLVVLHPDSSVGA
jgi:hypothetical protein